MTNKFEVYKCNICGNIIEVLEAKEGILVCCDNNMTLCEEKTEDQGKEKHVPVVTRTNDGYNVKVGSVEHPMEEDHYIYFIEIIADGNSYIKYLKPGDKPEASFILPETDNLIVREYCTLHGLWKA
ncbi:MAG: desulfoferrodoxin [Methanobacteriaceae archaeon]|nr:desulfoferrodoxin [Methanobacteriaceae archaeon]